MTSYVFDIGEKARTVSRFIGHVRSELQKAFIAERAIRKLTQQQIANELGVNRSVINRQLMGTDNITLRRVAEFAWVLGWDIDFVLRKRTNEGNHQQAKVSHIKAKSADESHTKPPVEIFKKPNSVSISVNDADIAAA